MHPNEFSSISDDVAADPTDFFAAMRRECPVYHDESTGIYWVTRYDDVRSATQQISNYSNRRPVFGADDAELEAIQATGYPEQYTMQGTDPPDHTRYRKLVYQTFSPKAVQELEPSIEQLVDEVISAFIDRGSADFISEFAMKIPGYVMSDALGIPRTEHPRFLGWIDQMVATVSYPEKLSREEQLECKRGFVEYQHYFADVIEQRRANPTDDIIGRLVASRVDGERPLTVIELLDLIRLIFIGGNETTAGWIGGSMLIFLERPELLRKVQDDRAILPAVLEETLRLVSPSRWGQRRGGAEGVETGTVDIPYNAPIRLAWSSANRDEIRFPNPDEFDLEGHTTPHMAFGHGIHFCIGANLARAEARIAFNRLFDRMTDFELAAPRDAVKNLPLGVLNRLNTMPLRFRAR